MRLGLFRRNPKNQAENQAKDSEAHPAASDDELTLQTWNEILSMIRGTHPRCNGNPQYVMGVEEGYGLRYIPAKDIYHALVTGITGCGKSIFLLSQIIQDILRGDTVFVFDPHGDLAEKLLTHIPRERWDDVVYVNPLTAKEYGRVVRYNFLEVKEGEEPTFVKRSFMDALQKNYPDFWGPRLDAILSHAIDLQFDAPETPTLPKLGRVLSKKTYRDNLLTHCNTEDVKDFWHLTFPRYRDDAVTSAQNKLYRILEEALIEPITSAEHSTIDFWNLMQGEKIVIFDIREGALTSEITGFIGTLFLARIYQAGMARERIPEEERRRVRVYVDEASRFMTDVLKENMQALRKYNVFLTVVCQNLDQFLGRSGTSGMGGTGRKGGELSQYTSTVIAFQSSHETARTLEGFFPRLPADRPEHRHEHLERAKLYCFYLSTIVGTKRENYYIKSIDPGLGENRPEEVIAHSLERCGEGYDTHEKHPTLELPYPDIGPAAYSALSELELRGGLDPTTGEVGWTSEESLQDKLAKFEDSAVTDALFSLKERGFATSEWKKGQRTNQRFWRITDEGVEFLYPTAKISGDRLGGAKHIAMLCLTCRLYREMGFYPLIISGKREYDTVTIQEGEKKIDLYPDMLLFPQYTISSTRSNPTAWDASRRIAVEIEAYPRGGRYTGAHLDRTKAHFVSARDVLKMPVIFVVQTEGEAEPVRRAVEAEGARVVSNVHTQYAPGNAAVRVLGREYEEAIGQGMSAGTRFAMWVRKLAEMSREANISDLGEPEDFFEGEKVPEYADHRWTEEMKRREKEAEKRAAEGVRKEEPVVGTEGIPGEEHQERAPAREEDDTGEKLPGEPKPSAEENLMSDPRRTTILTCLKEGLVFWKEGDILFAGKEDGGVVYKRKIGTLDDTARKLLELFNIALGALPDPRREKIANARKEGLVFWSEKMRDTAFLYAGKIVDGELEKKEIGFFDDACKIMVADLGVSVGPAPPLPSPSSSEDQRLVEQLSGQPKREEQAKQPTPPAQPKQPEKPPAQLIKFEQPSVPTQPPVPSTQLKQPQQQKQLEPDKDFESWVAKLKSMDLKSQVAELKRRAARWRIKKISDKEYCYARVQVGDGRRKDISVGPFDEELKKILKEKGVLILGL